jgi:hypothetical protein
MLMMKNIHRWDTSRCGTKNGKSTQNYGINTPYHTINALYLEGLDKLMWLCLKIGYPKIPWFIITFAKKCYFLMLCFYGYTVQYTPFPDTPMSWNNDRIARVSVPKQAWARCSVPDSSTRISAAHHFSATAIVAATEPCSCGVPSGYD